MVGKTLGPILSHSNSNLPGLNATLCARLCVVERVSGHTETRPTPVLQWEDWAWHLSASKKVNSLEIWVKQETLPWSSPPDALGIFTRERTARLPLDFVLLLVDLHHHYCYSFGYCSRQLEANLLKPVLDSWVNVTCSPPLVGRPSTI